MHRHPRLSPAVYQVSITGPYRRPKGAGDTPSRRRIFVCRAGRDGRARKRRAPKQILATLMRRAYRRPVTDADLEEADGVLPRSAGAERGLRRGIETALSAILVSPQFLFRIEQDPPGVAPGTAYRVSDLELASRLSFFLWSSIPDDELLDLAERGELSQPDVLEQQVAADAGRSALANPGEQFRRPVAAPAQPGIDHAGPAAVPRLRRQPAAGVPPGDRALRSRASCARTAACSTCCKADYTFLNERLAKHYGIPHVYGSRFRRVALGGGQRARRAAAAGEHPDRDVLRHAHVAGDPRQVGPRKPPRHAAAAAAAERAGAEGQHGVGDALGPRAAGRAPRQRRLRGLPQADGPGGLRAENFDAVGRWRTIEEGRPDRRVRRPARRQPVRRAWPGSKQALLRRPELFVGTLTEKLLTFALGRGVEHYDAPAVRKIVREARSRRTIGSRR